MNKLTLLGGASVLALGLAFGVAYADPTPDNASGNTTDNGSTGSNADKGGTAVSVGTATLDVDASDSSTQTKTNTDTDTNQAGTTTGDAANNGSKVSTDTSTKTSTDTSTKTRDRRLDDAGQCPLEERVDRWRRLGQQRRQGRQLDRFVDAQRNRHEELDRHEPGWHHHW